MDIVIDYVKRRSDLEWPQIKLLLDKNGLLWPKTSLKIEKTAIFNMKGWSHRKCHKIENTPRWILPLSM